MFNIDDKELKIFAKNLKNVSEKAFPLAVRSTLDNMAYRTKMKYNYNIRHKLVIRGNKEKNIVPASVGYEKCSDSLEINKMQSFAGQKAVTYGKKTEQLAIQEQGETIIAKRKHLTKATKFARGGRYRNMVSRGNYLAGMTIKRISDLTDHPASTVENQFKQAVGIVHRTIEQGENNYINFLPDNEVPGHKFGVFQLYNTGSTKDKNGRLKSNGDSVKFVYSFTDKTQHIDPKPMLKPAAEEIIKDSGNQFKKEAARRIEKELAKKLR